MKHYLPTVIATVLIALLSTSCKPTQKLPVDYVDTSIGTGGHGHVFVGANVPFGFVQLGPTSIPQEWDWCSGYHQSDSSVIGFSHTHLSGTGIGDLFDITVMPVVGKSLTYARGSVDSYDTGLWSKADRTKEISVPGYYSIPLTRYGILAEMTATSRVGFHRYTFPEGAADGAVVFDLQNGGCWDTPVDVDIKVIDNSHIEGYRFSKGWADDQKIWFSAEFSKPFTEWSKHGDFWRFDFPEGGSVMIKVALSPTSCRAAAENMQAELPEWDFEIVRQASRNKWNDALSKVVVETEDNTAKTIFYTSLYHTMIAPSEFCDAKGPNRYTTFSLWDTYRAQMPLFSIIHPEMENDIMNSFLDIYDKQGKLPVWHLMGCETNCMVGNPGVIAAADIISKGFNGFNMEKAYEALKVSSMIPDRGQDLRMFYGFVPSERFNESVAYDMEYAIADWSVAQVAKQLGKDDDYNYFMQRSQTYRRHFDPKTGFMRGIYYWHFREPFSPFYSDHRADDYCEGNAWQYTWLVPHDVKGLVECFGSKEKMIQKLDSLFIVSSELEGDHVSSDISGLIGQYAHGNEPSHHILYLYTMLGQPWKTAELVRKVCSELYSASPDGLCGNEDVGQMSAWYILSSMGFYQVEPTGGKYYFGSPLFDKVTIALPDGKNFVISAEDNSYENKYIYSVSLNGHPYTKPYIDYKDIMAGGELSFKMSETPHIWFCPDEPSEYVSHRPAPEKRMFTAPSIEQAIRDVTSQLTNPRLKWMFANCFPNTLDTTVDYYENDGTGHPDTFVYTGDIHAMWLRDSGAQVWPYLRFASSDTLVRRMLEGVVRRQFKCLILDPYANAFNYGPTGSEWMSDYTKMIPELHERKYELDSQCYPIRLAYGYWKTTGDTSVFDDNWIEAITKVLATMHEQQRFKGIGSYKFQRRTHAQYDTKGNDGYGNPYRPTGLIASSFRPSDDATVFEFLIPSNFFAVTSLRKAAEILETVNKNQELAQECRILADEVELALKNNAVFEHPKYGKIYAFEVDGFGNAYFMDDANVPSLLAMSYLGDVPADDHIYQNTRRFVLSEDNPFRFSGPAGEGIGGPHVGKGYIWPMSIMMRAFTSKDNAEIQDCILTLMNTDAGTGFMHESFYKDDASNFTRKWFAWQNTLFGELILKLIDDGKIELLNEII